MKLLLDTHAFIWWDSEPEKLSPYARALCQDAENVLLLSVVSAWEMQIKSQLGKLKLKLPLAEIITGQQRTNNLTILPVTLDHVLALDKLPAHHKDPFDRLLIAQTNVEEVILVSGDPVFSQYSVKVAWQPPPPAL
jgi:PIN domain nuclease of toxin-antitoxin system